MNSHHRPSVDGNTDGFSQQRPVNEGWLRVGPLVEVPQVLRELGFDPMEVIDGVGLDLSLFEDSENAISFAAMGRLLKRCAARTQCPHFGLLVGQRGGLASLGIVGQLLQHSPDVGSALRGAILHLHLHDRGAVPALAVERGVAVLSYLIYQPRVEGTDQIYDGAIAIIFNTLRALCGPAWLPTEALFSRRRPGHIQPYRDFFGVPLRFDREQTALVFPAKWLDRAVPGADHIPRQRIERRIAALASMDHPDLVSQLRRVLRVLLIARRSSLEQVAQLFSMHGRTLNRRLKARGTTFQALADEVRYEIARQLVEHTHMSMSEIAATLDYATASAFTRAFRRWSGTTPAAWRARLDAGD